MDASRKILAVLLFAALACSMFLFHDLSRDRFLRGTDAYYYALQANYWAKTGEVKIPDSSLIHRVTGIMQKLGLSTETSVRVWETVSLFLLSLAAVVLLSRRINLSGISIVLWFSISPSILFTAIEFPKIFSAILLLPLWFYPLGTNVKTRGWAILIAVFSIVLHRAAFPLALVFSLAVLMSTPRETRFSTRDKVLLTVGIIVAGLLSLVFLKDRLHLLDLNRISLVHLQPGILSLLLRGGLPWIIKVELLLVPLGFAIFFCWWWKKCPERRNELLIPVALCLPAVFPMGTEEVLGVGERYAILVPTLLMVSALYLSREHCGVSHVSRLQKPVIILLAVLVPILSGIRLRTAYPTPLNPNLESFERLTDELKPLSIPMLIARKDYVFYYKFRLMREGFPYEPEDHWDRTRVWRLLYKITPEELNYYLPERCRWNSGLVRSLSVPEYSLVRDDCWDEMRMTINPNDDPDLYGRAWRTWINPSQKRPSFLYQKHKGEKDSEFPAI